MKFKLKRLPTDEELEEFNRIREVEFPDTRMSAAYMASLDLYEPTKLDFEEDKNNGSK